MLAGLFLIFGMVFLYDGIRGYPKSVELARKKEWFMTEFLPSFDKAKLEGRLEQWIEGTKARKLPVGRDGEPPRWVSYAAQNGWEENPKLYSQREIDEQFWFAYGCFTAAAVTAIVLLRNRNKVLIGGEDHWITPEGVKINYADIFRIDKRKWEHKGLAYSWHRVGGAEKKEEIDDLKFIGAGKILERMLSRFSGELIEKISEPDAAEEPPAGEAK